MIAPHLVPHAVEPAVAADLRARLAAAGTELFDLADRGRYRWNGTLRVEPIWEMITGVAAAFTGTPLVVAGGRGTTALTRYDRPLTLRAAGAEVIRLRLWLR